MTQQYWQGDLVQGSQIDSYYDLTLKAQMGFDFVLLLKVHDDLFIKPFTLITQLRSSQHRKVRFILETVLQSENIQKGRGSGRCHTEL